MSNKIEIQLAIIKSDVSYIKEKIDELKTDISKIHGRLEDGDKLIERSWNWTKACMIAIGFVFTILSGYIVNAIIH